MSALHEAVARAIAEAMYATEAEEQVEVREAAAAAIRVVLAEATDALGRQQSGINEELRAFIYCDVVRTGLDALGEQA